MPPLLRLISPAAALLLLAGCDRGNGSKTASVAPPIAVETESVKWSDEGTPASAPGLLARKVETDFSFKTGGVIAEVNVRPGDEVVSGQILGSLQTQELDAQVGWAQSTLNQAKREFDRQTTLFATKVGTLQDRQNAESQVEQAETAVRAAQFNRETAVLRAPGDGRILARYAEPGEIANAGQKIVRFASDSEGWLVRVGLAQRDVARIQVGDTALIGFAGVLTPLAAKVARIAEEVDAASRTTLVELRLDAQPPPGLRSGMVGRAVIMPQKCAPRPVVPLSALVEGDGHRANIFRVEFDARSAGTESGSGIARRTPVQVVEITEAGAVLRTGLPEGTPIVTMGAELLTDGAAVVANSPLSTDEHFEPLARK